MAVRSERLPLKRAAGQKTSSATPVLPDSTTPSQLKIQQEIEEQIRESAELEKPDAIVPKKSAARKTARKATAKKQVAGQTAANKPKITSCADSAIADDNDEAAQGSVALAQRDFVSSSDPIVSHKYSAGEHLDDPPPASLPTLLTRVSRAIERELTQIGIIVGGSDVNSMQRTEAERRARTLASLARTLREVMRLRASEEKQQQDDDAVPRDIDELRRQLTRRLDQLVAEAKAAHPGAADD